MLSFSGADRERRELNLVNESPCFRKYLSFCIHGKKLRRSSPSLRKHSFSKYDVFTRCCARLVKRKIVTIFLLVVGMSSDSFSQWNSRYNRRILQHHYSSIYFISCGDEGSPPSIFVRFWLSLTVQIHRPQFVYMGEKQHPFCYFFVEVASTYVRLEYSGLKILEE